MSPIFRDEIDNMWYFWDECQIFTFGPFETIVEAEAKYKEYIKELVSN